MTVVGKGGKKGTTSKRNPCPPGSKKNQGGNKPHISKPPKKGKKHKGEEFPKEPLPKPLQRDTKPTKKPTRKSPEKREDTWMQKKKDKKPEKPANKRTGQDYRDWADLRDRIKKHKESRKDNFRRLPGRM